MKAINIVRASAIFATLLSIGLSSSASAHGDEIDKGWLMIRGSKGGFGPNKPKNYQDESDSGNGKLNDVSILCSISSDPGKAAAVIASDGTRVWPAGSWATALSTAVINKGGHVYKDPLDNNPNHCVIYGLTAADLANVFSNF
jgi:hypothetical protein